MYARRIARRRRCARTFPGFTGLQAFGLGIPSTLVQGIGNPKDSFSNKPLGLFWQDSVRVRQNLTLNLGVRYDVEFPPQLSQPNALALAAYNQLGLQKGIQTDNNNIQPRVGLAWNPRGDGKSVLRASYGIFYDHPLLGLYFLGDASDGSKSGQLLFAGAAPCDQNPAHAGAGSLNATNIFQGILTTSACLPTIPGYLPNQQRFDPSNADLFINQNYLNPATFFPVAFQPFGYPQGKNFVYAYAQQANLTFEQDLGHNMSFSLGYNFNGGRHLNRPINANTTRGDLMVRNWQVALNDPTSNASAGPLFVGAGAAPCGFVGGVPWVSAALTNFFRPGGLNPAIASALIGTPAQGCINAALAIMQQGGLSTACDPATNGLTGCVPFSDMDANYSNGSSVYHGLTANLKKRFGNHYEFLASYTWSHAIDDSTDLQSPLAPQDSYFPGNERSTSLFDQRHRMVFSGVYQSGKLSGSRLCQPRLQQLDFRAHPGSRVRQALQHHHGQRGQLPVFAQHRPSQRGGRGHAGDSVRADRGFKFLAHRIFPGALPSRVCRGRDAHSASARRQPAPQRRAEAVDDIQRCAHLQTHQLQRAHEHGPDYGHVQPGQPVQRRRREPVVHQCRTGHRRLRSAPVPVRAEAELVGRTSDFGRRTWQELVTEPRDQDQRFVIRVNQ